MDTRNTGIGPDGELAPVAHVRNMRAQFSNDRKQVLFLTGITEDEYYQFSGSLAVEWLTWSGLAENAREAVDMMRDELIASWWMNHLNERNGEILETLFKVPQANRYHYYRCFQTEVFRAGSVQHEALIHSLPIKH